MIGVGAQDSLEQAQDFVAAYNTKSFPMLWDPSFESWIELGINGQPAGLLVTPDGEVVAGWRGGIPENDVLEAAALL